MATAETATIVTLHQPRAKTPAERAKAYRDRKRAATDGIKVTAKTSPTEIAKPKNVGAPEARVLVPVPAAVTRHTVTPSRVTPSNGTGKINMASVALALAAFGLAAVGVTMNGWFARSLGSSDIAGWLFLAIGVAADLAALAIPSCAARQWQAHRRGAAAAGWLVWTATFAFAVIAGIGFASVNISDVTASRASRVTPAVEAAKAQLADAMTSRDRECAGGVGKNCRAREEAVAERRRNLDAAMHAVMQTADPQIEAASKMVAWLSFGTMHPTADDFAMLRLILLALLPQLGGILLMIGRNTT